MGTVLFAGLGCDGWYKDFIVDNSVVFPALSRPRRRMEYSVCFHERVRGVRYM